jgi:uncharacterized iron-regulated protein
MFHFFSYPQVGAALCLMALTACTPARKNLIGDPENPYPQKTAPKIGDIVHMPTGVKVTMPQMLAMAGDARIVYVGEAHDNPAAHRLELQVLKALDERHPGSLAIGMEMFTPSQQQALDCWIAGNLEEKTFLRESRWFDGWKMDFDYYRDLLVFARDRHIPVIALNAEKKQVLEVRSRPIEQLSPQEQSLLPELDLADPYQRAMVTAIFGNNSHAKLNLDGFVRAQTLRDETMADSAVRYLESPAGRNRHMVIFTGGDHIIYGFGIPRRVFRRLPVSYVIIGGQEINIGADKQDRLMDINLPDFPMVPYDFKAYLAYEDLPAKRVLLGVGFEPATGGTGLSVITVLPGSNAERDGVKQGDIILTLDGMPLKDGIDLVYAIKAKQMGDHGVFQVKRKEQTLSIDVTFKENAKHHP